KIANCSAKTPLALAQFGLEHRAAAEPQGCREPFRVGSARTRTLPLVRAGASRPLGSRQVWRATLENLTGRHLATCSRCQRALAPLRHRTYFLFWRPCEKRPC